MAKTQALTPDQKAAQPVPTYRDVYLARKAAALPQTAPKTLAPSESNSMTNEQTSELLRRGAKGPQLTE